MIDESLVFGHPLFNQLNYFYRQLILSNIVHLDVLQGKIDCLGVRLVHLLQYLGPSLVASVQYCLLAQVHFLRVTLLRLDQFTKRSQKQGITYQQWIEVDGQL